jgi:hypothetical protein
MSRTNLTCCPADRAVQVREGEGWRLAFNPLRQPFPVLVGGRHWAAELSLAEAQVFQGAVARLVQQHADLVDQLMAEESLSLELETPLAGGRLWLTLEGDRTQWSLGFVLTPEPGVRGLEGHWEAGATAAFAAALGALRLAPAETDELGASHRHC